MQIVHPQPLFPLHERSYSSIMSVIINYFRDGEKIIFSSEEISLCVQMGNCLLFARLMMVLKYMIGFLIQTLTVRSIMDQDPAIIKGVFIYEIHPCRSFPGDSLPT